ncbi:hypothetical protein [Flavobacterium foetidum]|uniref:hypothetical protein n=1 Tax=Flavobacterium foetidum TaxID=2026681 RepID=UPI001075213B|nr:hypothetical protein [Flavobacterium foetidum]KAF2517171.1 hypothetical protein E0W73_03485 [Flavobacterium foetidum]
MKINYANNIVVITLLPVLLFVSGCISVLKNGNPFSLDQNSLMILFLLTTITSYLFLKDLVSVFISMFVSANTLLGTVFLMDFFDVCLDNSVLPIFIVLLGVAVLTNTFLLLFIHQNKKSSELDALAAVNKTMSVIFPAVLPVLLLLVLFSFSDLLSNHGNDIKWIISAGSLVLIVNSLLLLPVLSVKLLPHINQERQQDDLKPSFSEKLLMKINVKMDGAAKRIVWIVSPLICNKKMALLVFTVLAVVISSILIVESDLLFLIADADDRVLMTSFLVYFFALVFRYRSYMLALIPALMIVSNFIFLTILCAFLNWRSSQLIEIVFLGNMVVTALGAFAFTEMVIYKLKEEKMLSTVLLDSGTAIFRQLLASSIVMIAFVLYAIYINQGKQISFFELFSSGIIVLAGCISIVFPILLFGIVFFNFHRYFVQPCKRKIKSIYF